MPSQIAKWSDADRTLHVALLVVALSSVTVLILTGLAQPEWKPDTPSYLNAATLADHWGQTRTPFYGWIVAPLLGREWLVVLLQIATYHAAAFTLALSARTYGASRAAVLAVFVALAFSTAYFLSARTIIPELPAASGGVFALAGTIRLTGNRAEAKSIALVLLGSALAYLLRPIFLPIIIALPALYIVVSPAPKLKNFVLVTALAALPFVLVSGMRLVKVGDFSVVSYGGYQMSGISTLELDDDIVARLSEPARQTAHEMLLLRAEAESRHLVQGLPAIFGPNPDGKISYVLAAYSYFDLLTLIYDDTLRLNLTLRQRQESWVAFNARLMRVDLAVVEAAPSTYLKWILGAATRFTGHAIIVNPLMLLALASLLIVSIFDHRPHAHSPDVRLLVSMTLAFLFAGGLLAVATSFPVNRYIQTASVLLPACPLLLLFQRVLPFVDRIVGRLLVPSHQLRSGESGSAAP